MMRSFISGGVAMNASRRAVVIGGALALLGSTVWIPGRVVGQALRIGTPAPEITGAPWINSSPLTIEGLRGRVVLVEFWTFG